MSSLKWRDRFEARKKFNFFEFYFLNSVLGSNLSQVALFPATTRAAQLIYYKLPLLFELLKITSKNYYKLWQVLETVALLQTKLLQLKSVLNFPWEMIIYQRCNFFYLGQLSSFITNYLNFVWRSTSRLCLVSQEKWLM